MDESVEMKRIWVESNFKTFDFFLFDDDSPEFIQF